jgi:hypothetical protein
MSDSEKLKKNKENKHGKKEKYHTKSEIELMKIFNSNK